MGIQAQVCGFILLMIIALLTVMQPRIHLRTQQLFDLLLLMAIISITLDGVSILIIRCAEGNYGIGTRVVCKAYLVSLALLGWISFLYLTLELEEAYPFVENFKKCCWVWTILSLALIVVLPIYFHDAEDGIYTYGPSVAMTYVVACSVVLMNLIILTVCKKHMDPRRWFSGITWMVIWIVAAMIQFFNNELLLVGYAGAIGVSILFLKLENPEGYLERRTGVYNEQALRMFLDDSYKKKRPFYMLRIVLNKLENQEEILYTVQMDSLVRKITAYFESLNGVSVFKHAGWEYTLLFLKEEQMNDAAEAVLKRFDASWHIDKKLIDIDVEIIKVPDCYIVYDANQMLEVLQMFVMHSKRHGLTGIQSMEESWFERKKKDAAASKTIEDAIRENRIEVFYQPIYSTKEKCFVSAEALSRIRTKDGSILPPAAFIPVAEKNGMIIPIGEIVFRKTCEFIQTEKLWEKGIQYIEINLSALQCSQDDLAENYIRIMEETGINPQMINLEITESAALESKDVLLANMNKLIEYGVSFSLDDFGTGYSNLNYILELPVQIVKFDRQMTTSYFENEKGRLIMEAAIGMIKAVGMKIVSEGVETKEQLDTLSEIEINYIQGFYFSKPVCGEEFLKLL